MNEITQKLLQRWDNSGQDASSCCKRPRGRATGSWLHTSEWRHEAAPKGAHYLVCESDSSLQSVRVSTLFVCSAELPTESLMRSVMKSGDPWGLITVKWYCKHDESTPEPPCPLSVHLTTNREPKTIKCLLVIGTQLTLWPQLGECTLVCVHSEKSDHFFCGICNRLRPSSLHVFYVVCIYCFPASVHWSDSLLTYWLDILGAYT